LGKKGTGLFLQTGLDRCSGDLPGGHQVALRGTGA
jgi:hypothetical protein